MDLSAVKLLSRWRTRGKRAFLFWFFMRKRRNINFQEYFVEGRNHSYTAFCPNRASCGKPAKNKKYLGAFAIGMLSSLKRAINAFVASSDHLNSTPSWIWSIILSEKRKQPHSQGLWVWSSRCRQLRPENMGTAPLKNGHRTTYSHGPGTSKFLCSRAHKISIYTLKTEGAVQVRVTPPPPTFNATSSQNAQRRSEISHVSQSRPQCHVNIL